MPDEPRHSALLPRAPRVTLTVVRDRTEESRARGGFVDVRRVDLVATYEDGARSAPFAYDVVERRAIDAVVIVAFERGNAPDAPDAPGERLVYLRSCTRPPLQLRAGEPDDASHLWELPAGLVDPHETPRQAAARELHEELGFVVKEEALTPLGAPTWPAPGFVAEKHVYFCVDVTGAGRGTPTEDGSALERGAAIVTRPLAALLDLCREGGLPDAKTELALRRFAERT